MSEYGSIAAAHNMSDGAAVLLEGYEGPAKGRQTAGCLDEMWDLLSMAKPACRYLDLSVYRPASSLQFLDEIAQGKQVREVSDIALMGLDYRTHLNIQGRITAGMTSQDKGSLLVAQAIARLESFENDFGFFVDQHKEEITSGLRIRKTKSPASAQMETTHLWRAGTYGVPYDLLSSARFDRDGRDLRTERGHAGERDGFAALLATVSLDVHLEPSAGHMILAGFLDKIFHTRKGNRLGS